ncbi:hypothetical protein ACIRP0_23315 [Streptomyces sp. NPDC101733]
MIVKAADHAAASLDEDGLPPASPDYWELPPRASSAPPPRCRQA